jgi:hypothetical protein
VDGIRERLRLIAAWLRRQAVRNLTALWIFLPVALIALALAGYGWWWQTVADGMRASVATFQAQQVALGREVKWDSFTVQGFPYKVEGTLSTLHLTAPDRGAAYDGERIVVRMQPFGLNSVALSLEGQQHFFYARERWIEAKARADTSLVTLTAERDSERIDVDLVRLTGKAKFDDKDVNFIVDKARSGLTFTRASDPNAPPRVQLLARLQNIALQGNIELPLGPAIAWVDVDASATVPSGLTEASASALIDGWRRAGTPIEVRRFELEWGGVMIGASGAFKIDAQSMPEGRMLLTLGNHPRILELMRDAGWIKPETEALARKVLDVLAFMSGDEHRRVSVPLRIEKGDVYLGPARVATLTPQPVIAQPVPVEPTAIP